MDSAKKVTFDPTVRARSVTLAGDVFDPSGTLTGGSTKDIRSTLTQLDQLRDAEKKLKEADKELSELQEKFSGSAEISLRYASASQKLELCRHALALLRQKRESSQAHSVVEGVRQMEEEISKLSDQISECASRAERAEQRERELQERIANFASSKDTQLRLIEQQISAARQREKELRKETRSAQERAGIAVAEVAEMSAEMESLGNSLRSAEATVQASVQSLESLRERLQQCKSEYEEAKSRLVSKKSSLLECDKAISDLRSKMAQISSKLDENSLRLKQLSHKVSRFHLDRDTAKKTVAHLESKHPWIELEKQFFGKAKTDYDFTARDPSSAEKKLSSLMKKQAELEKSINKKVVSMISEADRRYKELQEKKAIVEKDRRKIKETIDELDAKKLVALDNTFKKVNRDFGSIFSTLLPGAKAKIDPVGKTVLDGLEIKVGFGDVWKDSLSELSGGQRSLLALSLILALCLFKPAPMYILDEIDSALDLSHTENIGTMLKNHFADSQFIIVSLKPGMFKNANVLFQTKLVDGSSVVTRTEKKEENRVQKKRSRTEK